MTPTSPVALRCFEVRLPWATVTEESQPVSQSSVRPIAVRTLSGRLWEGGAAGRQLHSEWMP